MLRVATLTAPWAATGASFGAGPEPAGCAGAPALAAAGESHGGRATRTRQQRSVRGGAHARTLAIVPAASATTLRCGICGNNARDRVHRPQASLHFASVPRSYAESLARCQGTGDPGCWGESHGRTVRSAGSFSASPSANPAGRRKRLLSCGCVPAARSLCSLTIAGHRRHPAPWRPATGRRRLPWSPPSSSRTHADCSPAPSPPHAAPVTAKTPKRRLQGPGVRKDRDRRSRPLRRAGCTASSDEAAPSGGAAVGGHRRSAKPELLVPGTLARYVDGLAAAPMSAPAAVQEIIWAGNQLDRPALHLRRRPRVVHLARL